MKRSRERRRLKGKLQWVSRGLNKSVQRRQVTCGGLDSRISLSIISIQVFVVFSDSDTPVKCQHLLTRRRRLHWPSIKILSHYVGLLGSFHFRLISNLFLYASKLIVIIVILLPPLSEQCWEVLSLELHLIMHRAIGLSDCWTPNPNLNPNHAVRSSVSR